LDAALQSPKDHLPSDLINSLDNTICKSWQRMSAQRRQFLELLSRIELTVEQASVLAIPEERREMGLDLADSAFLENPYLIYEATRLTPVPVSIHSLDRGLFPTTFVRNRFPIPDPSGIKTAVDVRRMRALVIQELEEAAGNGDTLVKQSDVITALRKIDAATEKAGAEVTADLLAVAEERMLRGGNPA
jgi:hypothetical protein